MKTSFFIAATALLIVRTASADTSYLLVQGPFGLGSSTETFRWQVNYAPGALTTGLDLASAVFGPPTDTHTTYQGYEVYSGSNTINGQSLGVSYIDFGSGGSSLFTISFTLDGTTVLMDPTFDPGWVYYVAGGAGAFNGGPYDSNGSWISANDGIYSRTLSNGSFDGWAFGENAFGVPDATIAGFSPATADFTGAQVVNYQSVPEPGSAVLLAAGGLLLFRRRR